MIIEINRNVNEMIIAVSGILDTATAPILESTITENINEGKTIVLDFKELKYISSDGLRVFLNVQKILKNNSLLKVLNVCDELMNVFELAGFTDFLIID